ncbi:MAG: hypothetical protein IJW26_00535 [Clostridia bacterium]|nr:hypothetical protein [Clostridia bacterium]
MKRDFIRGISVCNPVDIEENYLNYTIDYAIKEKYNHVQYIGPIHNPVTGNVDGMIKLVKYAEFNEEKNLEYVEYCQRVVNVACKKAKEHGIKNYMWHHELELPVAFSNKYPECLNERGDIEVTSPVVKDYLENKMKDFFDQYPYMDGLILTLHETRVPLLKLTNQKLGKVERVKYVTEVLYNSLKAMGKELIVRPFASIEEDYVLMTKAYEEISTDMLIMDKWTQFDWSLTMPHNAFFDKIKNNPLMVETDIFGEFFGKGKLPLMLKAHILNKYAYCQSHNVVGYCSRIDRNNDHPFGTPNEVNLVIMNACLNGENVDQKIDEFFNNRYGEYGEKVKELMTDTEEILSKIIYLKGFYFSELSRFPQINHSKNHFYFEMQKKNFKIESGEWFIPKNWERGTLESVVLEKEDALKKATILYDKVQQLKGKILDSDYTILYNQFANLYYSAKVWRTLIDVFRNYIAYFDEKDELYEQKLQASLDELSYFNKLGINALGDNYYCIISDGAFGKAKAGFDRVEKFVEETRQSFAVEKEQTKKLLEQDLLDFVVCGGANEGHAIKKEVNFSDTFITEKGVYRIAGSGRGQAWSMVNAHGWFSYDVKVKPNQNNKIIVTFGSSSSELDVKVSLNGKQVVINKTIVEQEDIVFDYLAGDSDLLTIRFDRMSKNTPRVYQIKVQK